MFHFPGGNMKVKVRNLRIAVGVVGVAQVLLVSPNAFGQGGLEEIIVTATRRTENLQQTPLAVTALSSDMLVEQNITTLQDLTSVIPNVLVRGGTLATDSVINMRGIPGVGTYVDGIWQVSGAGLLQKPFLELDRVEVLRGPQGTLYGRDSTGGSIQIYTKPPQKEFNGTVDMSVGSFARRDVSGSLDVPFTDKLRSKWTLGSYDRDGYITSQVTGHKSGGFQDTALRGDILWEPTDRFSVRATHQTDKIETTPAQVTKLIDFAAGWAGGYQVGIAQAYDIASGGKYNSSLAQSGSGSLGKWESRARWDLPTKQDLTQSTLTAKYQISDGISLKYLYGDTDVLNVRPADWASAEYNLFFWNVVEKTKLKSHEIQLSGEQSRMHWNAGVYSWDQALRNRSTQNGGADWVQFPAAGIPKTVDYQTVLNSAACQATAASKGLNFEGKRGGNGSNGGFVGPANGPNSWITPCTAFGGLGALGVQAIIGTSGGAVQSYQDGKAYFGEFTFDITKRLDITLGARHHEENRKNFTVDFASAVAAGLAEPKPAAYTNFLNPAWALGGNIVAAGPGSLSDPGAYASFDKTTYRFGMSYDVSDSMMVYLGSNQGFNSGGVNRITIGPNVYLSKYDPELIKSTELGLRSDFLGRRLRVNATLFNMDWIGIQIPAQAVDPVTGAVLAQTTTQNAAAGRARGVDLELTYAPTERLAAGANLGFLDTGFTDIASTVAGYNLNTAFTGAPDHTSDFWFSYRWALGNGGSIFARTSYSYTGLYQRSALLSMRPVSSVAGADPRGDAGDFWNLGFRLVFKPASGKYDVSLYGNNLTNEYNLNSGFMHQFWNVDFGTVDAPREIGLTFKVSF